MCLRPFPPVNANATVLALALVFFWARAAAAHVASDGYLTLDLSASPALDGEWDLSVRDIDTVMPLRKVGAASGETSFRPSEVRDRKDDIMALALSHLVVEADGAACPLTGKDMRLTERSGRPYVSLSFVARCSHDPDVLGVGYSLFFDTDPQHHGLARILDGDHTRSIIFSARYRREDIPRRTSTKSSGFASAVLGGLAHIATGADHLLFLVALLLPCVLTKDADGWRPAGTLRGVALTVLKVVTAFTVAHSLTLALAVTGVVRPLPRVIEPAIALSIVFAAVENLTGRAARGRWRTAFVLGLLHGFAFSSALVDLGLRGVALATTLVGFNLGIELGQLLLVLVVLPLLFGLRTWGGYRVWVLRLGSAAIALVACVWVVQRALPSDTLPAHASSAPALVRSPSARRGCSRDLPRRRAPRVCPGTRRSRGACTPAGSHPAGPRAVRRPAVRGVDPDAFGGAPPP